MSKEEEGEHSTERSPITLGKKKRPEGCSDIADS